MTLRITLISILMVGQALTLSLHAQETSKDNVKLKTAFIGNRNYLVRDEWTEIPLNLKSGEDMNSASYGGKFYPMLAHNSLTQKEKRPSIANQRMEIWVDVDNSSQTIWKLESVQLVVLDEYQISQSEVEQGLWKRFQTRLNRYSPRIYLEESKTKLDAKVQPEYPVTIYPNGTKSDNRFAIQIMNSSEKPLNNIIYRFELQMVLSNAQKTEEPILLKSDKPYFLGFIK